MHNLKQLYPVHKLKNYSLDLLFGEQEIIQYLHSDDHLVPPDFLHHIAATFSISCEVPVADYKFKDIYNFKKMDLEGLLSCLSNINWDHFLNFDLLGLNGAVRLFYDALYAAIDINIPKIGPFKSKFPAWYTAELKQISDLPQREERYWCGSEYRF